MSVAVSYDDRNHRRWHWLLIWLSIAVAGDLVSTA
jgi:hypothetical protein